MKFRKKPVVIDAMQFDGSNQQAVLNWADGFGPHSEWVLRHDAILIPTLEGDHWASVGDWIIRGVAGEFYPCKPDIFAKTYEAVEDAHG